MKGWLVNDRLTAIEGTRTFWHHLLEAIPGLVAKAPGTYRGLAEQVEAEEREERPDYIIRNAAYFRALNVRCPVISFVQDIVYGSTRRDLIEACEASRFVVFNSEYTRSRYPELDGCISHVIPIGTDGNLFKRKPVEAEVDSVLWVGSKHAVKGFDAAVRLAVESARPWVFVMKDDANVTLPNVTTFHRIPQEHLASIAALCAVGVCTSTEETQHLAGIEMGLCGLPLVATNVGIYHNRPAGAWGQVTNGNWHAEINAAAALDKDAVAAYWRNEGLTLEGCMDSWRKLVANV